MVKEITIFTRATCAPCKMLKTYLNHKGIAFKEVNVDEDLAGQRRAYELSGFSIVPLTLIERTDGSRQIVTGYNLSQLVSSIS